MKYIIECCKTVMSSVNKQTYICKRCNKQINTGYNFVRIMLKKTGMSSDISDFYKYKRK